jgi:hypothetical protein
MNWNLLWILLFSLTARAYSTEEVPSSNITNKEDSRNGKGSKNVAKTFLIIIDRYCYKLLIVIISQSTRLLMIVSLKSSVSIIMQTKYLIQK